MFKKMVFNLGKIRTTMKQLRQNLTPDKMHMFGTKVNTQLCKLVEKFLINQVNFGCWIYKFFPIDIRETIATGSGYGPEVEGFETAKKEF